MASPRAVLGFRPHTYWTAAVAVGGSPDAPAVVHRRRFEFAGRGERFIYHQAAEAGVERAAEMIAAARSASIDNAAREVRALVGDLQRQGLRVRLAASAAATAKLPERLEDILAAHSRIHAAEGTLCREIIAGGCAAAGLEVRRVVEREAVELLADRLGLGASEVTTRLKLMGATLGPPWSEDYRLATLAAWLQL
jgi:hypothetical protein